MTFWNIYKNNLNKCCYSFHEGKMALVCLKCGLRFNVCEKCHSEHKDDKCPKCGGSFVTEPVKNDNDTTQIYNLFVSKGYYPPCEGADGIVGGITALHKKGMSIKEIGTYMQDNDCSQIGETESNDEYTSTLRNLLQYVRRLAMAGFSQRQIGDEIVSLTDHSVDGVSKGWCKDSIFEISDWQDVLRILAARADENAEDSLNRYINFLTMEPF